MPWLVAFFLALCASSDDSVDDLALWRLRLLCGRLLTLAPVQSAAYLLYRRKDGWTAVSYDVEVSPLGCRWTRSPLAVSRCLWGRRVVRLLIATRSLATSSPWVCLLIPACADECGIEWTLEQPLGPPMTRTIGWIKLFAKGAQGALVSRWCPARSDRRCCGVRCFFL
jgi:hypothetical protein